MKIKQTLEYELEVHVERDDDNVYIVLDHIDSDGDQFHTPRKVDNAQPGFDGLERGEVLDVIAWDDLLEASYKTDEQIVDDWFNSPYGVA